MTDIMKLADDYAECMYLRREKHEARAALQSAIEALQAENERLTASLHYEVECVREISAERDALAAKLDELQRKEPVAYWVPKAEQFCIADKSGRPFAKAWQPLYAAPKALAPLTEERVTEIYNEVCADWVNRYNRPLIFARAIEAAHGIGGTP